MKKSSWLCLLLLPVVFLTFGLKKVLQPTMTYQDVIISGKIQDKKTVYAAVNLLQKNLKAASEKDLPNYLATLVTSARQETEPEIQAFFSEQTLEHRLISVQVKSISQTKVTITAQQETLNLEKSNSEKNYPDHQTEANHTLIIEDGQWKIAETIMSATYFLN